jgi:hypothetical protein
MEFGSIVYTRRIHISKVKKVGSSSKEVYYDEELFIVMCNPLVIIVG